MFKSILLCFLLLIFVNCDLKKSWSKFNKHPVHTPKFVDIYTNHDNFEEVLKQYSEIRRNPKEHFIRDPIKKIDHKNDDIESEFGEIVDLSPSDIVGYTRNTYEVKRPNYENGHDISNFNVENLGNVNDEYVDNMVPLNLYSNARPKFKTQKYSYRNNTAYVERIPKYMYNSNIVLVKNNTKAEVNDMLKKYINKLYLQKYNTTVKTYSNPTIYKIPKNELNPSNSKFLDGAISAVKNKTIKIANKFLSLFQVVQFSNSKCTVTSSSGTYDGVCYYSSDCVRLNGTSMGNFKNTCGGSSGQNCTYFESPNYPNYYPANDTGMVIPTTQAPTTVNPTPDPRWKYYHYTQSNFDFWPGYARQETSNTLSCIFRVLKTNANVTQMRIDFLDFEVRKSVFEVY
ncbi:unnamed protein product [Brassicogethes aeneus]|uniref:Uncharacterized protein n=1 Tax=Brassicogethes aeneus TaxID=1431903 RepID=A0A9P0FBX3_BRAAE|nr:unnamed protein product [Brassicogethes aeneus]